MSTNYPLSDIFYIYGLGAPFFGGGSSATVNLAEALQISDTSLIEGLTYTDITSDETIQLMESLVTALMTEENCFPIGGHGKYPLIVLQRRPRVCEGGMGSASAWAWSAWEDVLSFDFDKVDAHGRHMNRPYNEWKYRRLPTQKPIRDGYGTRKIFPSRIIPAFEIDCFQLLCDQELSKFLLHYAASWIETQPTTPGGSAAHNCGLDNEPSELRRILYYPMGLAQENIYGNPVGAIQVEFETNPLEAFVRYQKQVGAYENKIRLVSKMAFPESLLADVVSADWSFNDDEAIERERPYPATIPWGTVVTD